MECSSLLLCQQAGVGKVEAGKCGTFENGAAKLKLCVDPVQQWGSDVVQVRRGPLPPR
jgi:hypothetical protein